MRKDMAAVKVLVVCLLAACLVEGEETKDIPCWRGEQCNNCNTGYEGVQNGVKVCCQQCYQVGMTMIGGDVCTCNMPEPTGGAPTLAMKPTLFIAAITLTLTRGLYF